MTWQRLSFDEGEDAFDTSELIAYETTKARLDATGEYNPKGQTRIRNATLFLRGGAILKTTFYADDWQKFQEAMHDRQD